MRYGFIPARVSKSNYEPLETKCWYKPIYNVYAFSHTLTQMYELLKIVQYGFIPELFIMLGDYCSMREHRALGSAPACVSARLSPRIIHVLMAGWLSLA